MQCRVAATIPLLLAVWALALLPFACQLDLMDHSCACHAGADLHAAACCDDQCDHADLAAPAPPIRPFALGQSAPAALLADLPGYDASSVPRGDRVPAAHPVPPAPAAAPRNLPLLA
ncbi:MAG: hypothetical protein RBT60_08450 [Candidatus Krumholzibacteria bacterium]|jgi:hypothetical protein|nr:hypothetical protein [Candidatus Krumholzibacteria bacterium]